MRKLCAISLGAFYLLLTTGAFACVLHCSVAYFLTPKIISAQHHEKEENDHHDDDHENNAHKKAKANQKDDCGPGKDCDCCSKDHGLYIVKENLNNQHEFSLTVQQFILSHPNYLQLPAIPGYSKALVRWPDATGPPCISTIPLYISYRTLLI
jgi:hypothetical protein